MKKAEFYYNDPDAPKPNKPNLIGATVLIEYDQKLLLEHRADSERWAIIGGSLKPDEGLLDCAIREVKEETAINLTANMLKFYKMYDDPSIIISYPDGNIFRSIMAVYRVRLSEEPKRAVSEESRELRFFSKEELNSVKIVETHTPILQDYLNEKQPGTETIDISQEIFSCKVYPGDPVPAMECILSTEKGDICNLTAFSMCAHNGTHVDAPFHFMQNGDTVDKLGLEPFVGDCYVVRHEGNVTAEDAAVILDKARLAGAPDRILIAGEATVTADAARVFAQVGIKLLGNESQTVGPEDGPMEVHLILLGAGVVLLEGILLTNIVEGRYFLSAAPLNLGGCDGAPCRAYLMKS
ncbi:MAG: NUDIX domain-containing protein [Lachnospiraceae bacterium]|nr:NUDIX domain-containing protein [Lachnospiraceae bacterium]